MRNRYQQQKWQRRWRKSSTLLAALLSLLMVLGIDITLTQAQEAAWREVAAQNIETYRKGDLTVVVTDANGTPIPNVDVHVAMKRHAYNFGSAISQNPLLSSSSDSDGNKYRKNIRRLFNEGTTEDALKWTNWDDLESRPQAIATVKWLRDRHLKVHGHNLVWPDWDYSPASLKTLYDNTLNLQGMTAAAQVLHDQIIAHIRDEAGYFKGQIPEWDVINEPIDNQDFQQILGQSFLVDSFNAAHQADPDAVLYVNQNLYQDSFKADEYESLIQYLLDRGAPIGGIGIEGHIFDGAISIPDFLSTLDRFAKFNLPIKITEFDILTHDKQLQADVTRDFMTAVFSHPATDGFIMWGFWDGAHWLDDAPIYDQDWSLKLSGRVYKDLVFKEWWTDVVGKTDANGKFSVRGFLGDYDVTACIDQMSQTVSTTLSPKGTSLIIGNIASS